ncbi:hypothetical protein HPB49_008093 [Dermacentor silvarum]|uniref:Uncharacterized protein n=1 Tax=Dermacentor silvarum TaxID=543639 RepID=A0ACB8DXM5_DERSI|nr:hypothetical protein HPB49_008093 [Dermacentor silvarum]
MSLSRAGVGHRGGVGAAAVCGCCGRRIGHHGHGGSLGLRSVGTQRRPGVRGASAPTPSRRWCNAAGSVTAFTLGLALRVLGGEPVLGIPAIMHYPLYDDGRQLFPFKTATMLLSVIKLLAVSRVADWVTGSKRAGRLETLPSPVCQLSKEPTLTSNDLWK